MTVVPDTMLALCIPDDEYLPSFLFPQIRLKSAAWLA